MRINAFVARCGLASRRGADELVDAGRVTINGSTARVGESVDPDRDEVAVDGRPLVPIGAKTTILLNKPAGYLVSRSDPYHTRTVYDLLPPDLHRLVPVGRLDLDTEGALLLTDDGQMLHEITHPSHGVPKLYRARVKGRVDEAAADALRKGVDLDGVMTAPAEVRIAGVGDRSSELDIVLREGRKRQVRRMCREVGHRVQYLKRVAIGGLELADLPLGKWRTVSDAELALIVAIESAT